jgi:hypothetical protein
MSRTRLYDEKTFSLKLPSEVRQWLYDRAALQQTSVAQITRDILLQAFNAQKSRAA